MNGKEQAPTMIRELVGRQETVTASQPIGNREPCAVLFDVKRCVGCNGCVLACREKNQLSADGPLNRLGERSFLAMERRGGRSVRRACLHCAEPACVSACPVGALKKREDGSVTYTADLCIGCRYCVFACPYDVPQYEWSSASPRVRKCQLCWHERQAFPGSKPACVQVCPTGALAFGSRETLLREARTRIAGGGYVDHVYGETEAGGTSVLIISDVPFESLGLPTLMAEEAIPHLTWNYLSRVPNVATVAAIGLSGLWWIIERRRELGNGSRHE